MAGIYGGIQQSSISTSGPKLPDGFHGIVEIIHETVKNGFHGMAHIAEMVVHESNHHEAPVGFRPSWTANFKQPNTLGNVMCHIGACYGIDPKQEAALRQAITEQVAEYAVSEHQPLRGKFVEVTTEEIDTKNGNKFLLHRWAPTKKTFPSRINDAAVAPPSAQGAPQIPQGAPPVMPGAFVPGAMPSAFAPPQLPGMPGGAPALPGAGAPALPGAPMLPAAPMSGQGAPPAFAPPGAPAAFAPPQLGGQQFAPPAMNLPPLPMTPPPVASAPPPIAFPPAGWAKHTDPAAAAAGWYYNTQNPAQMKTEADLRAGR